MIGLIVKYILKRRLMRCVISDCLADDRVKWPTLINGVTDLSAET
jgi:hypothetical protein